MTKAERIKQRRKIRAKLNANPVPLSASKCTFCSAQHVSYGTWQEAMEIRKKLPKLEARNGRKEITGPGQELMRVKQLPDHTCTQCLAHLEYYKEHQRYPKLSPLTELSLFDRRLPGYKARRQWSEDTKKLSQELAAKASTQRVNWDAPGTPNNMRDTGVRYNGETSTSKTQFGPRRASPGFAGSFDRPRRTSRKT